VIGKVCQRGSDVRRLLYYLFTEGLAGEKGLESEHRDVHLVAGWDDPARLEPPRREDGRRELGRLAELLNAPLALADLPANATPVYHLAISAAKDPVTGALRDRRLSDTQWADIAAEYVDRLGLAARGDTSAVRWVAVRHANDHVHVVATLVRQDGRRVTPYRDFLRSREASHAVEARYGLVSTAPADRTGTPQTTRGEQRKHAAVNRGRAEWGQPPLPAPDRDVLRRRVRTALAGSDDLVGFLDRLRQDGVLVRERYSTQVPGEVTGYAVALPRDGVRPQPIWFGGGKLAPDLSLPQLQRRWADLIDPATGTAHDPAAGPAVPGRDGIWAEARTASRWAEAEMVVPVRQAQRGAVGWTDLPPDGGAGTGGGAGSDTDRAEQAARWGRADGAAQAAGDLFAATARLAEGRRHGPLTRAAQDYDRAARPGRRAASGGRRAEQSHRAAQQLLGLLAMSGPEQPQLLALLRQLARLAEALARLRELQGRAGQARAARAAEQALLDELTRRAPAFTTSRSMAPYASRATTSPAAWTLPPVRPQTAPQPRRAGPSR